MEEKEDYFICHKCAKDEYLKNYIKKNAFVKAACTICLNKETCISLEKEHKFSKFCCFLIRYHFPEHSYNGHWGGDDLPKPFYQENPIISHEFKDSHRRELEIETFLNQLFLFDEDESIPLLYAGFLEDGSRMLHPQALKDEKSKIWEKYKQDLRTVNHFLIEAEATKTLQDALRSLTTILNNGETFYRARIGYNETQKQLQWNSAIIKIPYADAEIASYNSRFWKSKSSGRIFLVFKF